MVVLTFKIYNETIKWEMVCNINTVGNIKTVATTMPLFAPVRKDC